ncbi:hypothetical protein PVK06_005311 [Gossypium arboreum]|uniref:Uncharacterized protein n=1 Tax=Gossypium arboreum TaxID=29729 RepID=A0ABR0QUB2_GOSAR|nr:hypothetical protein PVK06_005311 [Gossypium arboreum]
MKLEAQMTGLQTNLLQWLGRIEHWQWTQSYDDGFRYGQITNNLVEAVNFVLRRTCHLPIFVVFLATFNRLAILGPKIRLRQVKQTEIGYVHVEAIRKAMAVNARRAQTMNAKLYSCDFESFQLGICSFGMLILRALSSDKAKYEGHGQLLPLAVVMGIISDAIFGINQPLTVVSMDVVLREKHCGPHTIKGSRAADIVLDKCLVD